jgi:hypothetical protein
MSQDEERMKLNEIVSNGMVTGNIFYDLTKHSSCPAPKKILNIFDISLHLLDQRSVCREAVSACTGRYRHTVTTREEISMQIVQIGV